MRHALMTLFLFSLLMTAGCPSFGRREAEPVQPPELEEEKRTISMYEETRRQALYAIGEKLKTIEQKLTPKEDEQLDVEAAKRELVDARELLDSLVQIEGVPVYIVSVTAEGLGHLKQLIIEHGLAAVEAEEQQEEKIETWRQASLGTVFGTGGSSYKTLKLAILGVLVVLIAAGYLYLRFSFGTLVSSLFGVVSIGGLIAYVFVIYWNIVLVIALIVVGAGVLWFVISSVRSSLFAKDVVTNVQNGRRALDGEAREAFDAATKGNMSETTSERIRRIKKANDVTSVDG